MALTDTNTKNNRCKKSSLFMCFKLVPKDNYSFGRRRRKDKTSDQVVTCFAVEEKEGVVLPAPTLPMVLEEADDGCGSRRRENDRDRWQALRAVLNETSLMKKINRRRKSQSKSSIHRTDSNTSSASFGCSSSIFTPSSLTSSSSSRTDHTSGSSSHERGIEVANQKQCGVEERRREEYCGVEERRREEYYSSNTSMCMFLIGLFVLIMWGKFFATLYTSIWFYLMPPRRIRTSNEGDNSAESEFDLVQYKKVVDMERTFERSCTHVPLHSSSMARS